MSPTEARGRLGLGSAIDVAAVRRAYADRLRALDIDADPAGYAALRDARDVLLAIVRSAARGAPDPAATVDHSGEAVAAALSIPLPEERLIPPVLLTEPVVGVVDAKAPDCASERYWTNDSVSSSDEPGIPLTTGKRARDLNVVTLNLEQPTGIDAHSRALAKLLASPDDTVWALDDDELRRVREHLDALLADPQLEEIGFRERAELWLAGLVLEARGRADPILPVLVEHFGWASARGRIDQPPVVAAALARHDDALFVRAVSNRGHRLHRAWVELTKPATDRSRRSWGVGRRRIRELLSTVRQDHPGVEGHLDYFRVGLWESRSTLTATGWGLGIFLALQLIRIVASVSHDQPQPAVSATSYLAASASRPAVDPERELAAILDVVGGPELTPARVDRENPRFGDWLRSRWGTVTDNGRDLIDGTDRVQRELLTRAGLEQQRASRAIAADAVRLHLDEAPAASKLGATECAGFWRGRPLPEEVARPFALRRRALTARLLLSADFNRPAPVFDGRFRISGDMIGKIASRESISAAEVGSALQGRGDPAVQCGVNSALAQLALALPSKAGLSILRKL